MTKRRTFIVQLSSIAAGAVAGVFASPIKTQREVSLNRLGYNHFAQLVGSPFNVLHPGGIAKLQLVEAKAIQQDSPAEMVGESEAEEFSLIFQCNQDQPLEQNTYSFTHPRVGRFLMFIVPVGGVGANDSRFYQAVFNRPALASLAL